MAHLWRAVFLLTLSASVTVSPTPLFALDWAGKIQQDLRDLKSPNARVRLQAVVRLGRYPIRQSRSYILKALGDLDPRVQRKAAELVAEKGLKEATPVLLRWLSHWDDSMRIAAAESLGKLGVPSVVKSLVRALADPEPKVRLKVVQALGNLRTENRQEVGPLLGRLRDTNSKVRSAVIEVLAKKRDRRAVIPLMARLSDPSREVRLASVKALGEIGDPGAGPALIRLIRDPNNDVASAAIETVGKLRYKAATEPLIDLFKSGSYSNRRQAAHTLGTLGTKLAIRALVQGLFSTSLRQAAQEALVGVGDRAAPYLVDLLRDPRVPRAVATAAAEIARDARITAAVPYMIQHLRLDKLPKTLLIKALSQIGGPKAQRPILELLEHPSRDIRNTALAALKPVIDARAAEPLLRLLKDPDKKTRATVVGYLGELRAKIATSALTRIASGRDLSLARAATAALSHSRDPKAIPALVALLSHKDRTLRRSASQALARIHHPASVRPLLKLCAESHSGVRVVCLQALGGALRGKRHDEALELFVRSIVGKDRSSFLAAVDAIAAMRDPRIPGILIQRYPALDLNLRRKVVDILGNDRSTWSTAGPFLLDLLGSEEPSLRAAAAWAVGKLRWSGAERRLKLAARDKSWIVRVNATAALARLSSATTTPVLRILADDPVPYVRANALLGLAWARPRDRGSIDLIVERLARDRNPWVRVNALRALVHLHPSKVVVKRRSLSIKQLVRSMASEDPDPRVRVMADGALPRRSSSSTQRWIGLYLLDQERKPYRNLPFILVTPSGLLKVAYSDGRGEAWEERIGRGHCFTELPDPSLSTPMSKN